MTIPGPIRTLRPRDLRVALPTVAVLCLLLPAGALAGGGGLSQKSGTKGCITQTGAGGGCVDGKALSDAESVVVSPDGTSAYVASYNAVAIFDRDRRTGALTQKKGTAGCISDNGRGGIPNDPSSGPCFDGKALKSASSVTVSPDGTSVYVTSRSSKAVAIFERDPDNGALTQKQGNAGCIAEAGRGGCVVGRALKLPDSVTVSPDGTNVYVASYGSNAVAILKRNPANGRLNQKPGPAGCISEGAEGGCLDGVALAGADSVTVSPDGANVYVASFGSHSVVILDRDPTTGTLTQRPGTAGCISNSGTDGSCIEGRALAYADSVSVSPDGISVYVTASNSGAVSIFDRDSTGALAQISGPAGCISDNGTGGACTNGKALAGASSVAISPDGTSAYVASTENAAVAIFDRETGTGFLTQKSETKGCISRKGAACARGKALNLVRSVTVSPDGRNVYTAADGSDAVAIFDRNKPPATRITEKPKKEMRTTRVRVNARVSFTSVAGATFECSIDGGTYQPCRSPYVFKVKSQPGKGEKHRIAIRATDRADVVGSPAVARFRVIRKG